MDLIDPFAARTLGRTGLRVSQLGFGCSTMGVLRSGEDEATATAALASAWRSGVRYFDTSPWYGRGLSEHRTGAFLRHVPRADYLLSSKVGRLLSPLPPDATLPADTLPFGARFDYSYDATLRSLEHSLQRLGLSHIDMLILHDLSPRWHGEALDEQFGIAMDGAQRALCELRAQGVVKAIGVGVNDADVCLRCLYAGDFDFFMLAGRLTLLDHVAALPLLTACAQRGVSVLAAAPFNSGILATGASASARFLYAPAPPEITARTRAIAAVCGAHGVPLGAAAIQFALGHTAVASVVASFENAQQYAQACAWLATPIPPGCWHALRDAGLVGWHPGLDP